MEVIKLVTCLELGVSLGKGQQMHKWGIYTYVGMPDDKMCTTDLA